jgi:hypothetical protein
MVNNDEFHGWDDPPSGVVQWDEMIGKLSMENQQFHEENYQNNLQISIAMLVFWRVDDW